MLTTTRSATANMCGYFSGLSSPSVTEITTTLAVLADVEQRRADQVADVLHEQQRALRRVELVQRAVHHLRVEVAARAGVDLHGPGAGAPDPVGVEGGLLVALDHADLVVAAELGDGALQQRRLARARASSSRSTPSPGVRRATPARARRPRRSWPAVAPRSPTSRYPARPRTVPRSSVEPVSPQPQVRHMTPPPSASPPRPPKVLAGDLLDAQHSSRQRGLER